MSVFKEKNGIFEGANLLCGPAGIRCVPAGTALTSRSAALRTTRLETPPGRYPIGKSSCLLYPYHRCDPVRPELTTRDNALYRLITFGKEVATTKT